MNYLSRLDFMVFVNFKLWQLTNDARNSLTRILGLDKNDPNFQGVQVHCGKLIWQLTKDACLVQVQRFWFQRSFIDDSNYFSGDFSFHHQLTLHSGLKDIEVNCLFKTTY